MCDVDVTPAAALRPNARAPDAYANAADAVEDPGECERRSSAFWGSVSWFSGGRAETDAVEAPREDVERARDRAPGGATCQNRFLTDRGARDPFAPVSATVVLDARTANGRAEAEAEARTRAPFANLKSGRRLVDGGSSGVWGVGPFAFDRARGVWTGVGSDGARADVRASGGVDVDVAGAPREVSSKDASCVDATMDLEHEAMRAREARVRRYQASYDEEARRFASKRSEASIERVVATPLAAPRTPFVSSVVERSNHQAIDVDTPMTSVDDPAIRWIPLALDDGATVWIETAAHLPPDEQLSAWCRGAAPWPDVRTLSLGRDRVGLPPGAPGPRVEDERALETVRAALRAERRRALVASVASVESPDDSVDALRRELATCAREREDALAECARLRAECARLRAAA